MTLSKKQIMAALKEGKRVLGREVASEAAWLESLFEDDWSYLIRTRQVPPKRRVLHEKCLKLFLEKIAANEMTERGVRPWLRSVLTVEIDDSADVIGKGGGECQ